ncbi:DNA mismatch repair endonuclease MutL [Lutibacter sp. B2]|nr:DNA mismatch repair endonuclease MutL [Lutibacter sp. B2]
MEKRINRLDELIANKIAAGEVVDRPGSVVKELIENSIDAKASKIIVEIKNAGKTHIRITDNGTGIHPEDVEVAFERHATSKIKEVEDLNTILSLGFRGEALASIASVSQLELITKTEDINVGRQVIVHGGKIIENKEIGAPKGTTIIIKNLFYNVPARHEFMKSNAAETSYIGDFLSKLALAYPQISFRFVNNGEVVFSTSGDGKVLNNIVSIYGKEMAKNIIHIKGEENGLSIEAYMCKPSMTRGNRQLQTSFVNGRYIKSKMINNAISEAYKTLITINRYPICFVYLKITPNLVDVNIHPTKTEIRFKDPISISNLITKVLKDGLFRDSLIPDMNDKYYNYSVMERKKVIEPPQKQKIEKIIPKEPIVNVNTLPTTNTTNVYIPEKEIVKLPIEPLKTEKKEVVLENKASYDLEVKKNIHYIEPKKIEPKKDTIEVKEKDVQETFLKKNKEKSKIDESISNIKIIGQLFNSYLIGQDSNKMYLIDQHAAHERILYEWFSKRYKAQTPLSQKILIPILIELSFGEYEQIKEYKHVFCNLGFELEEFGTNTFRITSVPVVFGKPEAKEFFIEIVGQLQKGVNNNYDVKMDKIISMSCKNAIKANDKLEKLETDQLLKQLAMADNPYTCPHGRPIIISMTQHEIERKFKRT